MSYLKRKKKKKKKMKEKKSKVKEDETEIEMKSGKFGRMSAKSVFPSCIENTAESPQSPENPNQAGH